MIAIEERHIVPEQPMEDYVTYCDRLAPPRYKTPYDADPNCAHPVLQEMTPEFTQPPNDWTLPMGGFVMLVRDWVCTTCGGNVQWHTDRSELRFKDGKVRAAYMPVPRVRKQRDERGRAG